MYYLISPKASLFFSVYMQLLEVLSIISIRFTCFYGTILSCITIFALISFTPKVPPAPLPTYTFRLFSLYNIHFLAFYTGVFALYFIK